jgi:hypothetical protein
MKRVFKYLTVIISILVIFVVFSGSAFAACNTVQLVQKTDLMIQQKIDTSKCIASVAVTQQSKLALLLDGTQSAATVDNAFTNMIARTTDRLIINTDRIAAHSVDMAAINGDTIISEYIEVNIGGKTVLVDPVRNY